MIVDRERCPSCGRKALRHRTRTDDYRCKECGEIYSSKYFDVEEALVRLLRALADVLTPVCRGYHAPTRFVLPGSEASTGSSAPGCVFALVWIGTGIGIYILTKSWAWYLQWGAALLGGLVAAVVVGGVVAAFEKPKAAPPAKSRATSLDETSEFVRWRSSSPIEAAFETSVFRSMLMGLLFFPEDPSRYEKRYVIPRDGTTVRIYLLEGNVLPLDIKDTDVEAVANALKKYGTQADLDRLKGILGRLVPLTRSGDPRHLFGEQGEVGEGNESELKQ